MAFENIKIKCPGCGATIEFATTASLLAVCKYCNSVVGKSSEKVENFGIKSQVLPDYSKIKVGTIGAYEGKHFTVLGRVQIKYLYGFWNEWYIKFETGESGWLSDVLDEYILTVADSVENKDLIQSLFKTDFINVKTEEMEDYDVDSVYDINGSNFICIDKTIAKVVAAEGEIAFDLIKNESFKAIDFKNEKFHLTIDFSDKKHQNYIGKTLVEKDLSLNNVKTIEELNDNGNEFKEGITSFVCPSCGSNNPNVIGKTQKAFCISCGTELSIHKNLIEVLSDGKRTTKKTTLVCGDIGVIGSEKYVVIGVILKKERGESSQWVEYFLYKQKSNGGFIWLIEDLDDGSWYRGEDDKKNISYLTPDKNKLISNGIKYNAKYEGESYSGVVQEVWGSFNWEVNLNDVVEIVDYQGVGNKSQLISKEIYRGEKHSEVAFTKSTVVSRSTLEKWFGLERKIEERKDENYKGLFYSLVLVFGFILALILNNNTNTGIMFKGMVWSVIVLVVMVACMWVMESVAVDE